MNKIPCYDARVEVFNERSFLSVYLGETYWYSYCSWFGHNTSSNPDQDAAYHEIIEFVKSIINNEKFGVICFVDGFTTIATLYNMSELADYTKEKVLEDIKKTHPEICEGSHEITLRWCFWEGPENYDDHFWIK